jgi:hypothetical protein
MTKPSKTIPFPEGDLSAALWQLNYFFADESAWVPTRSKREQIDLFEVPIPAETTYYQRCLGFRRRPLMILSAQSLGRLHHCLFTANPLLEMLTQILQEEETELIEKALGSTPGAEDESAGGKPV